MLTNDECESCKHAVDAIGDINKQHREDIAELKAKHAEEIAKLNLETTKALALAIQYNDEKNALEKERDDALARLEKCGKYMELGQWLLSGKYSKTYVLDQAALLEKEVKCKHPKEPS